ncbi:hypothetical protein B0H13DRAFT_2675555 [Mycena leptocephala]|nr:hypothetical protein B0H13DRAFT_2675555 [Mycena leptocephala]
MWTYDRLVTLGLLSSLFSNFVQSADLDPVASRILRQALEDGIDLAPFNFTAPALQEIVAWAHFDAQKTVPAGLLHPARNATTVDVHAHHVPNWFRTIEPSDGGLASPVWTLELQLQHMANQSIGRSILSIPKPNIFPGDRNATMAIARLLNENSAALVKALPHRFSFFATSALPHIFVHPANPLLETAGTLVLANPTVYPQGIAEFFFETARTFMDLALSSTLQNLTHVNFIVPHVGGSLPSIIDRTITGRANPNDTTAIMEAFHTRCWWDNYPWIPAPLVDPAFDAIATSPFLDDAQKQAMRSENIKRFFKGKIEF